MCYAWCEPYQNRAEFYKAIAPMTRSQKLKGDVKEQECTPCNSTLVILCDIARNICA